MTPGFFLFLESKLVSLVFGVTAQSLAESKLGDDPRFRLDFAALSDSVIECKDQKSGVKFFTYMLAGYSYTQYACEGLTSK